MNKPRFRWVYNDQFKEGGYWRYKNYEAETIHLMKVYGHTNIGRQFEKMEGTDWYKNTYHDKSLGESTRIE